MMISESQLEQEDAMSTGRPNLLTIAAVLAERWVAQQLRYANS